MKSTFSNIHPLLVAIALLMLQACQENGPIQLLEDDINAPMEISFFRSSDTTVVAETIVDLAGLTQKDEEDYPGSVLVTGVKTDLGMDRNTIAYARILLENRSAPFLVEGQFGKIFAYPRLDVGKAKLDNSEFDLAEWIMQIRSLTLIQVRTGVFYRLINDGNQNIKQFVYKSGHQYQIEAEGREAIRPFELEVPTPDEITVINPKPLSLLFRDEDFVLRWKGANGESIRIVISTYDERTGRAVKPLMELKANPRSQSLRLTSKLLSLVPPSPNGRYMMSVISANRRTMTIDGYPNRVLVQGASIHNLVFLLK